MDSSSSAPTCEHCGAEMKKWTVPSESGWENFHYVCFNDECGYYTRGWDWMMEKYKVKCSYRNRLDLGNGKTYPLPTWSQDAHKDRIIE